MASIPKSGGKRPLSRELVFPVVVGVAVMLGLWLLGSRFQINSGQPSRKGAFALIGQPAPEIEFDDPAGQPMKLSEKKGGALLVNFWATWCEACMEELPGLRGIENHFAKSGLTVLAFNVGETGDHIRGKLKKNDKMPRNLIFDFKKEHLKPYGVATLPLSLLIGADGNVRDVLAGPRNWAELKTLRTVEAALK